MRRIISICLLALSAAALLAAAPAAFAASEARPTCREITRVLPMRISVGGNAHDHRQGLQGKPTANTVIFRPPNGRSAFAKPRRASRTKLVVVVPAAVARLLAGASGRQRPDALQAARDRRQVQQVHDRAASRRSSPDAGDGDGTGPGKVCNDDGSAITTTTCCSTASRAQIKTDPCLKDTDLDSIEDGWEYCRPRTSTIERRCPIRARGPTQRARPQLGTPDVQRLRLRRRRPATARGIPPLARTPATAPSAPSPARIARRPALQRRHQVHSRNEMRPAAGLALGELRPGHRSALPGTYNLHGNAAWRDDERDADTDGLGNWHESPAGPMTEAWWQAVHYGTARAGKESQYPEIDFGFDNEVRSPHFDALVDPDMDGDGVLDGPMTPDNDGVSNMYRGVRDRVRPGTAGLANPASTAGPTPTPSTPASPSSLGAATRMQPLRRRDAAAAHLRRTTHPSTPDVPAAPPLPQAWRPHPLSRVWALCLCAS